MVDKQRLNLLINNTELLSEEDYHSLSMMKKEHPYMQCLYPLMVISSKKFDPSNYKKHLQSAAIYSLDRTHLKSLLSTIKLENTETKEAPKSIESDNGLKNSIITEHSTVNNEHLPDSFFDEFYREMESLRKSKEAYLQAVERIDHEDNKKPSRESSASPKKATKSTPKTKKTVKSASKPKKASKTPKKKASTPKVSKKKTKPEPEHQSIIEEIELKEIKAISEEHLMEQINLITSFIEKEPSINKKMLNRNVDAKRVIEDLSESSTHLSEDVISETLAKLMIKQDRKEKAIDIYKKLIWKFPQKKAYFADQIKNLKSEE